MTTWARTCNSNKTSYKGIKEWMCTTRFAFVKRIDHNFIESSARTMHLPHVHIQTKLTGLLRVPNWNNNLALRNGLTQVRITCFESIGIIMTPEIVTVMQFPVRYLVTIIVSEATLKMINLFRYRNAA